MPSVRGPGSGETRRSAGSAIGTKFFRLFLYSVAPAFFPVLLTAGGAVSGFVRYQGLPPEPAKRAVTVDAGVCGKETLDERLQVGKTGGIRDAVVFLRGAVAGARRQVPPPGGYAVVRKGCRLQPRLLIVPPGAEVMLSNLDPILHSIRTFSRANQPVVRISSPSGPPVSLRFDRPEMVELRCEIHDGERGWVVVAENPYYGLTDAEGRFRLEDLPAGEYTLTVWHESFGRKEKRINVREGEDGRADFKLSF